MEDYKVLETTMDGQPYKAGHHAATLRRLLWREHLGLLPAQPLDASEDPNAQPPDVCPNDPIEGKEYDFVADPLSDEVWDLWTRQATTNTEIFRHLFRADPDDNSTSPLLPSHTYIHTTHVTTIVSRAQSSKVKKIPSKEKRQMLTINDVPKYSPQFRRLRIIPPKKQHHARPPARPLHARQRSPDQTRSD